MEARSAWGQRIGNAIRASLPARCAVCGAWPHGPLCPPCRRELAPLVPRCPGCALPAADTRPCAVCQATPPPWRRVHARVDYVHPWRALVLGFKGAGGSGWAQVLAPLWLDDPAVPTLLADADAWLPVPLSPARLAQRGHNQAWTLMQALARQHPTPAALPEALQRAADAPVLHHLGRAQRLAATDRLMHVPPAQRHAVQGRHVLVVDDVMTTGATLTAAARALLDAGAAAVSALVLARTPAPNDAGAAA